ncbi:hypothetical protein AQUCO_00600215v1 [Aquilegia coerulea]|uniref:Uncharacterized protein n=1 Tax=Aquilegia coerulea TaxID=218851 RepID=A0A2G5ENN4_AQUCA|nr:hypothetical protein AQUCO_00600215v1 [Aquilegia coerulea]
MKSFHVCATSSSVPSNTDCPCAFEIYLEIYNIKINCPNLISTEASARVVSFWLPAVVNQNPVKACLLLKA